MDVVSSSVGAGAELNRCGDQVGQQNALLRRGAAGAAASVGVHRYQELPSVAGRTGTPFNAKDR